MRRFKIPFPIAIVDAVVALLVLYLVVRSVVDASSVIHNLRDVPENYMVVSSVFVADFVNGEEAIAPVVYDREIKTSFWAKWSVKIRAVGAPNEMVACSGSGRHYYEPEDVVNEVTLEWYVGKRCDLDPGQFSMKTVWALDNGHVIENTANIFRVHPVGPPLGPPPPNVIENLPVYDRELGGND